ncbi:MAG: hypothetical protein SGI73_08225 [Chloroflexota bacterium]|nr:hypothetical protein [Chloroflexota bacterium]
MATNSRILDTNVLINANGDQSPQTSAECKMACLKLLMSAMASDYQIVIDGGKDPDGSHILTEYRHKLSDAGGGFGEMFLRWLLQNWQNLMLVPITPMGDSYDEFPQDKRLKNFDPRDHKWIATAKCCHMYNDIQPDVIQSADYKWETYAPIFTEHGVNIVFVCPNPATKGI